MINFVQKWKGPVDIDGVEYENGLAIDEALKATNNTVIILKQTVASSTLEAPQQASVLYKVEVKPYMTKEATPEFDFMQKWNKNIPMPLRVMVGEKLKETRGMVYMKLHGDIYSKEIQCCMKCGKPIDNPVSRYFGMGPICGGHNYINPFKSEDELKEAVENYRKTLNEMEWEGWIIKSAITNMEEIKDECKGK